MFQKIKKAVLVGLLSLLAVGGPLLVHYLFKLKTSNIFWVAEWSAGEFLSYYGSVLSFGSTIILSGLALWQNDMIRKESNKHTAMLTEMEQNKCCPFFKVMCIGEKNMHSNIIIKVSNITDNIALDVKILEMQKSFKGKDNFEKSYEILNSNDSIEVPLGNGAMDNKEVLLMEIQCNNIYGNKFSFNVKGEYNYESKGFEFKVIRLNNSNSLSIY